MFCSLGRHLGIRRVRVVQFDAVMLYDTPQQGYIRAPVARRPPLRQPGLPVGLVQLHEALLELSSGSDDPDYRPTPVLKMESPWRDEEKYVGFSTVIALSDETYDT